MSRNPGKNEAGIVPKKRVLLRRKSALRVGLKIDIIWVEIASRLTTVKNENESRLIGRGGAMRTWTRTRARWTVAPFSFPLRFGN
jgi:hypothetical protein